MISGMPFYGLCTDTLTSDKSKSTFIWYLAIADCHRCRVPLFYMCHTLLLLLLLKLCTNHAGITVFMYTFLIVMMGQVWGWAPLKPGSNSPVAFAADRFKAVLQYFPYLHVCKCIIVMYVFYVLHLKTVYYLCFLLLYCLSGLCVFVGRCSLYMLHLLHSLLFTISTS